MSGTYLQRILTELVGKAGGHTTDVYLRTYSENGGSLEAGFPPNPNYTDELVTPTPLVITPGTENAETLKGIGVSARASTGHTVFVLTADVPAEVGKFLVVDGKEYEIIRVREPIIFRAVLLKVALARRVIN